MKRSISLLLALCITLAMLPMSAAAATDKTTISIIAAEYSDQTQSWWKTFEKQFESKNKGIDLVVDVCSWNDIYTEVENRLMKGEAPDILNIDYYDSFQDAGMLLSVDQYLSDQTYDKFYDSFLDAATVNGKVWAIPDVASTRALYYNVSLLKDAGVSVPTTWSEVLTACQKLQKKYGTKVIPWGADMTDSDGLATFAACIWSNGGDFVDSKGNWNLNSDANVEAVEFAMSLYNKGYTNSSDMDKYQLMDAFQQGKVAMMIASDSFRNSLTKGSYVVSSIPANTGKTASAPGVMDYFMCFDNKQTKMELSAIAKFFDYFYEDETYVNWVYKTEGFLPATSTGMAHLVKADSSMTVWEDALESARFYPKYKDNWYDASESARSVMRQVLEGANVRKVLNNLNSELSGAETKLDAPVAKTSRSTSTGKVTVKWNAVNNAVKYKVEYSTNKTTWKVLKSGTTSTSVTHTSATVGTMYYYRVTAIGASTTSETSNVVSGIRMLPQPVVQAGNRASDGAVNIKWEKVEGATKYEVWRATSQNGTYKRLITTTGTSVTNTSAEAGKTYYYYVIAKNAAGKQSAKSDIVKRVCDLARPTVTVSNRSSDGAIIIKWEKITGATKYEVYRATSKDGTYTRITSTSNTTVYNTSTTAGKTYYYKVRALCSNASATSAYSEIKSRTRDLPRPDVEITRSSGKPKLSWEKVDGAVSYQVYRATSQNGTYSLRGTITKCSYTDTKATKNKTYYYKVVAVCKNTSGNSAYSGVVSIKATK